MQELLQEEGVEVADQSQVVVVVVVEVPDLLEGEEEVEGVLLVEGEEEVVLLVIELFECLQLQPGDERKKTRVT